MKSNRKTALTSVFKRNALVIAVAATAFSVTPASAQEADSGIMLEEVVVTGTLRDTIRNSIELKRQASTIVDAISASDIGVLPDLSVAETLERITGVTGDRFKGNASEISIRGLGPFLVSSTFNGREVTSGSGNRAVAFSQFPSELVNKAVVYKAQQADILEGGVAGAIDLGVIRPIDFGKRRIQGEFRANYNEYQDKINDDSGVGYRGSLSYTDVFDTDSFGTIGFAIGAASVDGSTPEESYLTSATSRACNSDRALDGGSNCSLSPDNERAADGEFYFIPNLFSFRQLESEETRDSFITTVQWQPNENWDITADYLFSNRFFFEDRHDLVFDDGRRRIRNWIANDDGQLLSYSGESRISTYGEYRERDEDYNSGGLNIQWQASDRLSFTLDLSYSDTVREQDTFQTRFRSERRWYDVRQPGQEFAQITAIYDDEDNRQDSLVDSSRLLDNDFYNDDYRARFDNGRTEDTISAIDLAATYDIDGDFFTTIKTGVRYSNHETNIFDLARDEQSGNDDAVALNALNTCAAPFLQSGFGDDAGASITEWATYDTVCAFNQLDPSNSLLNDSTDPATGDVFLTEDVTSVFAMANFDTEIAGIPVSGNFGVRVIHNDITSEGFRADFDLTVSAPDADNLVSVDVQPVQDADGNDVFTSIEFNNDYVNVLPSLNLNFALSDEMQLRTALYRAVSRPDMWWLGAGRDLDLGVDQDERFENAAAALQNGANFEAFGNPNIEAIESDNFDVSLGYYPNEDSSVSFAVYVKEFNAGFGQATGVTEEVFIDGVSATLPLVGLIEINDDKSTITGAEVTVQHNFSYLPEPLNGLGISAGYNYADTDFETPEGRNEIAGEDAFEDIQATFPDQNIENISDFISPAGLPGFSRESYNIETYWENYGWQARIAYKFRSQYLKPFDNTLNQTNRFVADTETVDASLSYKLTDALTVRFQVLNALNEPYIENRVLDTNPSRVEFSGRKFFAGIQFRL